MKKIIWSLAIWACCVEPTAALEIYDEPTVENVAEEVAEPVATAVKTEPVAPAKKQTLAETLADCDAAAMQKMISAGLLLNERDENGYTPLYHTLTANDDLAVSQLLIDAGADVNLPSANGMTPLVVATSRANELRLQQLLAEKLSATSAKKLSQVQLEDWITYQMGRAEKMLEILLKAGADIDQETPMGTPLMNAATNIWNAKIIDMLLVAGADVNRRDRNGRTALFYAHLFENSDIEMQLIKAGADINIRDKNGRLYVDIEKADFADD